MSTIGLHMISLYHLVNILTLTEYIIRVVSWQSYRPHKRKVLAVSSWPFILIVTKGV